MREREKRKCKLVEWQAAHQDRLCWDTGSNRGVTRKMLGRLGKDDWVRIYNAVEERERRSWENWRQVV